MSDQLTHSSGDPPGKDAAMTDRQGTSVPFWQRLLTSLEPREQERAESVLVVGLGRFGSALASSLVNLGTEVLAVDVSLDLVQRFSSRLPHVRQADATNLNVLKQLGAAEFPVAVVAIGTEIEASVLSTVALLDVGVKTVYAKAISDEHERILSRVGAHHVIAPEREMGERVAHTVSGHAIDYFALDEGFALVEVSTPRRYAGQTLLESNIRATFGVTVVCVKPEGGAFTYATPETMLGANDLLVVAGTVQNTDRFTALD